MSHNINFGDWFGSKKAQEYHRITCPQTPFMHAMGLQSFNSGTLYDVLLEEKTICVSGDESVFTDPGVIYDSDFAKDTYDKILHGYSSESPIGAALNFWWNGDLIKPLKNYDDTIHGDSGVIGALTSHHEFVLLPSGSGDGWNERRNFVQDVQTSIGGSGLYWTVPLCFHFGTSGIDGADCVKCDNVLFNAMLYNFDQTAQEKRYTGLKGDGTRGPIIVSAPATPYGKGGVPSIGLGPGVYSAVEDGGSENPSNVIAAPLDMHFNQNTGLFEAGSRLMVAAMMTPLDGITATTIDVKNIHETKQEDLCSNPNAPEYLGHFQLGRAMPLGVKGANPNIFGPDQAGTTCYEQHEKEVIVVVNRTPKSYSAGERVLVAYMDGEWQVIQSMAETDDGGAGFSVGRWGPTHYMMTNSWHYFRGREYEYQPPQDPDLPGIDPNGADATGGRKNIVTPQEWETVFHQRFYWDLKEITAPGYGGHLAGLYPELNNYTRLAGSGYFDGTTFFKGLNGGELYGPSPSHGYWQYTSFDMLSPHLGGVNDWNFLAGTHAGRGADGKEFSEETKLSDVYPFAGINFVDGYSVSKMSNVKTLSDNDLVDVVHKGHLSEHYLGGVEKARPFDATLATDGGKNAGFHYSMFAIKNSTDQVPADVALNGPPSASNGFPLESLGFLKECINFGGGWDATGPVAGLGVRAEPAPTFWGHKAPYKNLVYGCSQYLGSGQNIAAGKGLESIQDRYSWVEWESDGSPRGSMYDYVPLNNRKISFIPLTAELYMHYDFPNPVYTNMGHFNKGLKNPYQGFALSADASPPIPSPVGTEGSPSIMYPLDHRSEHLDILGSKFFTRETFEFGQGAAWHKGYKSPFTQERTNFELHGCLIGRGYKYDVLPAQAMIFQDEWLSCDRRGTNDRYSPGPYYSTWLFNRWNEFISSIGCESHWGGGGDMPDPTPHNGKSCHPANMDMYATDGSYALGVMTTKVRLSTTAATINFVGNQSLGADYKIAPPGDDPDKRDGQWGTADDKIYEANTSALYVRIVDAWPDEQTIFDPRYFSVHHFHAGDIGSKPQAAWYSGGLPLKANAQLIYGVDADDVPEGFDSGGRKYSNTLFSDGIYLVDIRGYDIDMRVPTYMGTEADPLADDAVGDFVPTGTLVNANSPLREAQDWRINPVKRGMLMPFNCFQRTIGVAEIHIQSGGTGYKQNDVLGSKGGHGGGAFIKVLATGGDGSITEVELLQEYHPYNVDDFGYDGKDVARGYNFFHTDFPGENVCVIDPRTGTPANKEDCEALGGRWAVDYNDAIVKFQNYDGGDHWIDKQIGTTLQMPNNDATGAQIFAGKGVVWDVYIPEKGLNRDRPVQNVALPSEKGIGDHRHGRAEAGMSNFVPIGSGSPDLNYDVFLHFHNDTSYTSLGPTSTSPDWLQYLTVELGPSEFPEVPPKKLSWLGRLVSLIANPPDPPV